MNSDSAQSFDQQEDLVRLVRFAASTESHFRHALAPHPIFIYQPALPAKSAVGINFRFEPICRNRPRAGLLGGPSNAHSDRCRFSEAGGESIQEKRFEA